MKRGNRNESRRSTTEIRKQNKWVLEAEFGEHPIGYHNAGGSDIYGMPMAELTSWEGDIEGRMPAWTASLIASFHICQLVNKCLLSPCYGPDNG